MCNHKTKLQRITRDVWAFVMIQILEWIDDNDNYGCMCCMCGEIFIGHKRSVVCDSCYVQGVMKDMEWEEEWTSKIST